MKFSVKKSILENAIAILQPFLEKKDQSSITSHIFLEIKNSSLTLKATDYEIGLKITLEKEIINSKEGNATANGVNFLNILRRLKDIEINIETSENHIILIQNKTNFKLPMFNPNEYPEFLNIEKLSKLNISKTSLINSFKKITPAIDNNNPKFELNGALIDIKSTRINFVSTDTRRLSFVKIENNANVTTSQIIIPKKAVIEIQKIFTVDNIEILYDETNFIIQNESTIFFTKLINGKYPDYEKIIPANIKQKIHIHKDEMIEAIKLVTSLFANIKITFNKTFIIIESLDEDSEAKTQLDCINQIDEDIAIAVNSKYLLDFLANCTDQKITLGFNDTNLPFYLEDGNFGTIIMPIII